ncbi:MAG: hypothetical protein J6N79_06490, partial [Psychrobacter sp.]|nr:hypothetical protein [Psychrobacter sp.]
MIDAFSLAARLVLDSSEYDEELKDARDRSSGLSSAWQGVGKAVKIGAAAIGAASVAVGALSKQSVGAYAEYEQLAGGVKKLYDTAADEVMKYASEAYKTSGMSANQYMEQATSFSAALVNSLNGDFAKAAEQTDVAMRAISDNFNTFGGDMSMIQGAFQGFAKQNYTMLDNLKLGYGGTKSEMERLIADANEYAASIGEASDLSIDSFSDIVTAIDLVQQKQGIAGTTAKEAATTIEGSLNMTKAAWNNLITGLADPDADIGSLVDNLVVAIVGENEGEGLLNQIIPAVERAVDGIGQLLDKAVPALAGHFPALVGKILPPLLNSAVALVNGLVTALPDLLQVLVAQAPVIIDTLVVALSSSLPSLLEVAPRIIATLVSGIVDALPDLVPAVVEMITQLVLFLTDNIPFVINAGIAILKAFGQGLINAIPILVQSVPQIIGSLVNGLFEVGSMLLGVGSQLLGKLADGIWNAMDWFMSQVISFASGIPSAIIEGVGNLWSIGSSIIDGLWDGISDKFNSVIDWIKDKASALPNVVKKVLGIASPSKVFMEIGQWIPKGLALGIEG